MNNETGKVQLSDAILQMKFMKKTKEKVDKQRFQAEGEEYFENELTTRLKKASGKYTIEPSYVFCEQLIEGRLSFRGMNPEIEKIIEEEAAAKLVKKKEEKDVDISDEQMAKHFQASHILTIGKKFHPKRTRGILSTSIKVEEDDDGPMNKRMFLKPVD